MSSVSNARALVGVCGALVAVHPAMAATPSGNVAYYGGHVISHVQVVPVMWGSTVSPDVVSGAEAFFATIVSSPYVDWLGEYDTVGLNGKADNAPGSNQHIDRGTVLPAVTITPANKSTSLSDANIQTELLAQLKAGNLPAPRVDAEGGVDTVYMVAFPAGISISDFAGDDVCSGACAYHWTITVPDVAAGVPYGVIPNCSSSSNASLCNLGSVFDTFTGDSSHELVESMTDTECGLASSLVSARPLAWFDSSQANGEGEVADICLSATPSPFVSYLGYLVQEIWSQRLQKCITNDPSLTLCDGKTRPCTPCTPADCSGATPTCNGDMSSPTWGLCVASTSDAGSSGGSAGGGSSGGVGSSSSSGAPGSGNGSGPSSGDASAGNEDNGSGGSSASSGGCALASGGSPWNLSVAIWAAGLLGLVRARGRRRRPRQSV